MVDGLAAHGRVRVGDTAEHVVVVLEDVGVDGADADAQVASVGGKGAVVVHTVPGDVQRDQGGHTRQSVDLGRVGDLLPRVAGYPRLTEHLEAGSGVSKSPGGEFDPLAAQRGLGVVTKVGECYHSGPFRSGRSGDGELDKTR